MSTAQRYEGDKKYYKIIDGSFRLKASAGAPGAVHRTWEARGDVPAGEAWEYPFDSLCGKVEGIFFHKGDYGKNLNIVLDKDADGMTPVISTGTENRYGESLLKVLPAIEKGVEYRFLPYNFATKEDPNKKKVGVSIASKDGDGEYTLKLMSPFFGPEQEYLEGYPEPTDEDKEDWRFYYAKAIKFTVKYAEEKVVPKFQSETTGTDELAGEFDYKDNDLPPSPF